VGGRRVDGGGPAWTTDVRSEKTVEVEGAEPVHQVLFQWVVHYLPNGIARWLACAASFRR